MSPEYEWMGNVHERCRYHDRWVPCAVKATEGRLYNPEFVAGKKLCVRLPLLFDNSHIVVRPDYLTVPVKPYYRATLVFHFRIRVVQPFVNRWSWAFSCAAADYVYCKPACSAVILVLPWCSLDRSLVANMIVDCTVTCQNGYQPRVFIW